VTNTASEKFDWNPRRPTASPNLPTAAPKIPCVTVKKTKPKKNFLLPKPWSPLTFKEFTKGLFNRPA
jgi:hypothetical protein